jgi:hypothetical protein
VQNCGDNSDEADCGDTSDEQSCVKVQISDLWFLNAVKSSISLSHSLTHTHTHIILSCRLIECNS